MTNTEANYITDFDKIKCTRSNIKEAWTLVRGVPYVRNEDELKEADASLVLGRKQFPDIKSEPTIMVVNNSVSTVTPFWSGQYSWGNRSRMVRIGPRFLAFHRLTNPNSEADRYTTFDTEISPNVRKWFQIYGESFNAAKTHQVESISFGYVNNFVFDMRQGFDTTKYFKFQLGVDANFDSSVHQLSAFNSAVNFVDNTSTEGRFNLILDIRGEINSSHSIQIDTQSRVDFVLNQPLNFTDIETVHSHIRKAQKRAKRLFFEFITKKTFVETLGGSVG